MLGWGLISWQALLLDVDHRKVLGFEGRKRPTIGDKLQLPILGRTLQVIADSKKGAYELYNGSLTADFLKDLKVLGSIITGEDLKKYKAEWMEPVICRLADDLRVYSAPPPASGPVLLFILRILDGLITQDPINNIIIIAEAFKYGYAIRSELGDPNHTDISDVLDKINSEDYINAVRSKIMQLRRTNGNPRDYGAEFIQTSGGGTVNVVVVASNGDAAVATSTINTMFGSLLASESTGIILNNEMDDFSAPHIINSFGLPPCPANMISGGKRPLSSSCPTIILNRKGDVRLAVGAAGGSYITTSTAQVIINNIWFNLCIKKAVDMPRIHHQLIPMTLRYEEGVNSVLVRKAQQVGHNASVRRPCSSVTAIAREDNIITAMYDYRRGGSTAGF